MKDGPDLARIAALIGDPARANMLTALLAGAALTVTELANESGITVQTASGHLARLAAGGLVAARMSGRHKYFALAGPEVAGVLESLLGLAAARGHLRHRPGPRDEGLRAARVCYDHLAGAAGVQLHDSLVARGHLLLGQDGPVLTEPGRAFLAGLGLSLAPSRRPLCRQCLDWSERRNHLAGALGAALLQHMLGQTWIRRPEGGRLLQFSDQGRRAFDAAFPPVQAECAPAARSATRART